MSKHKHLLFRIFYASTLFPASTEARMFTHRYLELAVMPGFLHGCIFILKLTNMTDVDFTVYNAAGVSFE